MRGSPLSTEIKATNKYIQNHRLHLTDNGLQAPAFPKAIISVVLLVLLKQCRICTRKGEEGEALFSQGTSSFPEQQQKVGLVLDHKCFLSTKNQEWHLVGETNALLNLYLLIPVPG